MKRDEERVARLLKAELPSEEEMELARLEVLQRLRSPGAPAEVSNDQGLKLPADEVSTEILEDPNWSRSARQWWQIHPIWLTAVLVIVALLSIPLARRFVANRNVYAIVENEAGPRYRVVAGQNVVTDVWTRLTVTLPDGSRVEMRPQSQLSVNAAADGLRVRLDRGGIIVNAARQRSGHLYVDTKDVALSVVGTVFVVGVEEAGSRVGVLEGKVQVKQGGLTKMLMPPEQMVTNPLMELPPLREQVAWSRYAQEHLALLPKEAAPVVAKQAEKPVETPQAHAPLEPPQSNPPTPAASRPQFEVASVKRNNSGRQVARFNGGAGRWTATNALVSVLIKIAYRVQDFQIIGAPAWISSERYDIEAKGEGNLGNNEINAPMLQALIEERFKAAVHGETRDMPVYFLTVAKSGSKLKASQCITKDPNTPVPPGQPRPSFCGNGTVDYGLIRVTGTRLQYLADNLSGLLKRKVLDNTGLAGQFDVDLKWTPDLTTPGSNPASASDGGPSIFTAIEEQLGLKLESGRAPIDVLVIDHIDHASNN
jgi:uncharacterized protein (TIGR03435 family)